MRALSIAFALLGVANIWLVFFLGAVHGVALTLIVPILLEYAKTALMLHLASKNEQAYTPLVFALEAVKFTIIAAVLFVSMACTDRDNRSYEMLYCADFVVAQTIGAIIYNIKASKMEKQSV